MDLLFHYVLGLLLGLAFFPRHRRLVLLLSPLAILPDLDVITFFHREFFYNIFFMVFMAGLFHWGAKRFFPTDSRIVFTLACLLLFSHYALDLGYPGFNPLFPLDSHWYYLQLDVPKDELIPIPSLEWGSLLSSEIVSEKTDQYTLLSPFSFVMFLLMLVFVGVTRKSDPI